MASLYANIAQVGRPADLAALLRPGYDAAGAPDQCDGLWLPSGILPTWSRSTAATQAMAVAELAQPLLGLEPGRRSFSRPRGDHPSSDRPIRVLLTKSAIA
jgi:cytosine/creatinine deaminase